ncbi:MAG: hypothetical protein IV097_01830 [Burkholderiaceae bacterium]|nr:hypothetical protein [Burkholderiaceae bacterium]
MSVVLPYQGLSRAVQDDARALGMAFLSLMLWEFSGLDLSSHAPSGPGRALSGGTTG